MKKILNMLQMYVPKTPTFMKGVFNNRFTAAKVCGLSKYFYKVTSTKKLLS